MITEHNFADDILELIEEEVYKYGELRKIKIRDKSLPGVKPDFEWLRKTQNYSLPIFSMGATEVIEINRRYYEILVSGWEKDHPQLVKDGNEVTIQSMIKSDIPEESILCAINDKISRLIYEYDKVIEATKESNRLFGINDEEKILLIHLNRYKDILESDTEQIDYLRGITLNKKISDLVLEAYIRFISYRLKMLNPEQPKIGKKLNSTSTKIIWKGSQKELCELFVELQDKGWIDEFKYGERNKTAQSICNLFDLTLTKKNENSNPENSFYQILKGIYNRRTKQRDYEEILGPSSERKFNRIKENES
ncbi:MAG: hypothetical protein HC831_01700 [Chloroflexia bacterium]|nr:hypothetical protein [Chloroflexia bacterium]